MHIYHNLNEDVKSAFCRDIIVFLIMIFIDTYCLLILVFTNLIGYFSLFLLGILVLNLIYSLYFAIRLLNKIKNNQIEYHYENYPLLILYITFSLVAVFIYYMDILKNGNISPYELAMAVFYNVICGIYFIYLAIYYAYETGKYCFKYLKETKQAVEEREYLLK